MSDHDWQAPGGAPQPPPVSAPQTPPAAVPPAAPGPAYGQPAYGQPAYGQPAYGAPPGATPVGPAPAGAPGWTPPPRPGLLPLHPLGFGTLLWAPFRTLRRNPAATFGSGLVVQLVSAIATVAVILPIVLIAVGRIGTAQAEDLDAITAGAFGIIALALLIPIAISIVGAAFLQGVMVVEVASGTLGERLRFGQLWRRAAKRLGPLLGWTLLVGAVVIAALVVLVGVVLGGAVISTEAGFVAGGLAVLLLLGFVVAGAWLGTKLALVPGVIVLEHASIRQAVARSWRLTDGFFWRTFGTILLVAVILNFASQVVLQPITLIGTILGPILDPAGGTTFWVVFGITQGLALLLSLVIGAITTVVQSALVAVILIDLRMRKEGLDLELQRAVEAKQAGREVGDPYRVPDAASRTTPASGTAPTWS